MDIDEIMSALPLDGKCRLLSGRDFWFTAGSEEFGIPSMMMTDGPHGLRKQIGDTSLANIHTSVPATCFPTASASACSFDTDLLRQMGEALGEECRAEGVSVILGPGINMKRSPLCGRNFEYFSEDPLLAGKLAAAMIQGVQSRGVSTSLKHYCANNQETSRLIVDSIIDERALHEIYLKGFEIAVKEGHPWTIMTAYNRLNGIYCSQNSELLQLPRRAWGFDGAYVTDWGALSESVPSVAAGLDLVMPGPRPDHTAKVFDAVQRGNLDEARVDEATRHVLTLIDRCRQGAQTPYVNDTAAHADLARRIAEGSAVLLENDGILPLKKGTDVALIGSFAKDARYQGAGSSKMAPLKLDDSLDAITSLAGSCTFARGYTPHYAETTEELLSEAEQAAAAADTAILFIGLPDTYESEGFDRTSLALPASHEILLERVCAANPNTVVVLQGGAPMDISWREKPRAVLLSYLAGERGGQATANILFGDVNPSGKLAESWPLDLEDTPCIDYYPAENGVALYRESLYIGYRYYDAAQVPVAYPFGYGLSYTSFSYSNLHVERTDDDVHASFTLTNTGSRAGRETVQLYVAPFDHQAFKAPQELKAFSKEGLEAGASTTVSFSLGRDAFAHWDAHEHGWRVEGGVYEIRIGSSSRAIHLAQSVTLHGDMPEYPEDAVPAAYRQVVPHGFTEAAFAELYGRRFPPAPRKSRPFTIDSTLTDMKGQLIARIIRKQATKVFNERVEGGEQGARLERTMFNEMPVRNFTMSSFDMSAVEALVLFANGHRMDAVRHYQNKYKYRF